MAMRTGYLDWAADGVPIQAGSYILPRDATPSGTASASNLWSPQAVVTATASPLSLVAPDGSIEFHALLDTTAWVSPDASAGSAGTSASHAIYTPANVWRSFPVKSRQTITLLASATEGKVYFFFNMLNNKDNSGNTGTIDT